MSRDFFIDFQEINIKIPRENKISAVNTLNKMSLLFKYLESLISFIPIKYNKKMIIMGRINPML